MRSRFLAPLGLGLVLVTHACGADPESTARPVDAGTDAPLDCGTKMRCGDACFDGQTDALNCGACGNVCSGVVCFDGVCGGNAPADVGAGVEASCVVLKSGAVYCWGRNDFGQAGQDPTKSGACGTKPCVVTPTRIEGLPPVAEVSVGQDDACARTADGAVYCWGNNDFGTLGHAVREDDDQSCGTSACNWQAKRVTALSDVAQVEVGERSVCARRTNGEVLCWGWDGWLALGHGGTMRNDRFNPARVEDLPDDIIDLRSGINTSHVCAVSTAKGVYCWGANDSSALGHAPGAGTPADVQAPASGTVKANGTPQLLAGTENTRTVYVSEKQTCGVRNDDTFYCIGSNRYGELGTGTTSQTETTTPANAALTGVATLGMRHSLCGLTTSKDVFCWGPTSMGESGSGSYWKTDGTTVGDAPNCSSGPCWATPRKLGFTATHVSAGMGTTLALGTDGKVYGWGMNEFGQTGHPVGQAGDQDCSSATYPAGPCAPSPVPVAGLP